MEQRMMKAAVLEGPRRIEVKEVPVPEAREGEIQIKVSACGVCGSDVHMWKAGKGWGKGETADFTMGHEFCGVVTIPATAISKRATASSSGRTSTAASATCAGEGSNISAAR